MNTETVELPVEVTGFYPFPARGPWAMLRVLCPGCHVEMQPLPQTKEVVCRQEGCEYRYVRFHAPTVELVQSE